MNIDLECSSRKVNLQYLGLIHGTNVSSKDFSKTVDMNALDVILRKTRDKIK